MRMMQIVHRALLQLLRRRSPLNCRGRPWQRPALHFLRRRRWGRGREMALRRGRRGSGGRRAAATRWSYGPAHRLGLWLLPTGATNAITDKAMHDALNAVELALCGAWVLLASDGAPGSTAPRPAVAMAAAAYQALRARHPPHVPAEADLLFREALREEDALLVGGQTASAWALRSGSPARPAMPRRPPCRGPFRRASAGNGGRRRPSCRSRPRPTTSRRSSKARARPAAWKLPPLRLSDHRICYRTALEEERRARRRGLHDATEAQREAA